MSTPAYDGLDKFLGLLRIHGVSHFDGVVDGDRMLLQFHPPARVRSPSEPDEPPDVTVRKLLEDTVAAGRCACGHDFTAHNASGECLHACPVAECNRKAPSPPTDE